MEFFDVGGEIGGVGIAEWAGLRPTFCKEFGVELAADGAGGADDQECLHVWKRQYSDVMGEGLCSSAAEAAYLRDGLCRG